MRATTMMRDERHVYMLARYAMRAFPNVVDDAMPLRALILASQRLLPQYVAALKMPSKILICHAIVSLCPC